MSREMHIVKKTGYSACSTESWADVNHLVLDIFRLLICKCVVTVRVLETNMKLTRGHRPAGDMLVSILQWMQLHA